MSLLGAGLVLLAVTAFSFNASVSALVLDAGIGTAALAAARATGTALLLGAGLVVTGRGRLLRVPRDQWRWLLLYGAGVALVQWAYFVAIQRLPIGLALLLEYLAPLLIALTARFALRRPVSALIWPALALALGGLVPATRVEGGRLDPIGILAAFAAAAAFATFYLVGERLVAQRDPISLTFWGFAVASAVSIAAAATHLPAAVAAGRGATSLPAPLGGGDVPVTLLVAWVVVLGTIVPFVAITTALSRLPAAAVSVAGTGEVAGAAAVAWWWFGQSLTAVQIAGFGAVVAGAVLALLARTGAGPAARSSLPQEAGKVRA